MMIEPNCFMEWDIYLDWLADQGFDQLREIPVYSLIVAGNLGDLGEDSYHYNESHRINDEPPYEYSDQALIGCTEQWEYGSHFNENFNNLLQRGMFYEGSPKELNSDTDTKPANETDGYGG